MLWQTIYAAAAKKRCDANPKERAWLAEHGFTLLLGLVFAWFAAMALAWLAHDTRTLFISFPLWAVLAWLGTRQP